MTASELIQPSPGAGITASMAEHRARKMVLHNSRTLCWGMMGVGVCSLFIGVCMVLMAISLLMPVSAITFLRLLAAAQWGLGGVLMAYMCPALWKWARTMAQKKVKMDERGVEFSLGSKKNPVDLFLAWDEIVAVKQQRVGNAQQFTIQGTEGSFAQFSSYTFFRPKRVARIVVERAGLTIQRG
jgi:hypothetical protein